MRGMVERDVIVIGRCPSQEPNSTVLVKVKARAPGVNPVKTPLELCNLANLDFDGNKEWMWAHMTLAGKMELDATWYRF